MNHNLAWELSLDDAPVDTAISSFGYDSAGYLTRRALVPEIKPGLDYGELGWEPLANHALVKPLPKASWAPSIADAVTLLSLGLGLWWCAGGPIWAGLLSILGDEIDGRIARARGTESKRGSELDWGADVALTTGALYRFGKVIGQPMTAVIAAPAFLYAQAQLRADGYRPPVGSARAAIMLTTMITGQGRGMTG